MPDREKVIKAIEICYTLGHNCTECPLFSEDDCNDKLMRDALSLLKEQEPRLLKEADFVEADGWGNIPAWFEHNPSLGIKTIDGWGIIKRENLQDKTTRYWTSRPTAEQRKATPWEPPKEETHDSN